MEHWPFSRGRAQAQELSFDSGDPASAAEAPSLEESKLAAAELAKAEAARQVICHCVGDATSPAARKIQKALRSPLRASGFDFTDTPLEEVVAMLQSDYGIPIQIDEPALEEMGIDAAEAVTISLNNISLRSALRMMLKKLGLTYVIRDEVLTITTPEEADSHLFVCVYDIRGLTHDVSERSSKAVSDMIASCVATETWAENGGGEAEIRPLKPGLLVISQTHAVHEEIRAVLETIRDLRGKGGVATVAATTGPVSDSDEVLTRSYLLQIGQPGDTEKLRDQIRDLIVKAIPDEKWAGRLEDGQPVVLSVLPDRVVLRHTLAVHEEVQTLLVDSGVAAPIPAAEGETAGREGPEGGGFFNPTPATSSR